MRMLGYQPFVISRNGVPGVPPEGQKRALGGSTKNRLHRLKVRPGPVKPALRPKRVSLWVKHIVGVSPLPMLMTGRMKRNVNLPFWRVRITNVLNGSAASSRSKYSTSTSPPGCHFLPLKTNVEAASPTFGDRRTLCACAGTASAPRRSSATIAGPKVRAGLMPALTISRVG
jgi:hypothetical protein